MRVENLQSFLKEKLLTNIFHVSSTHNTFLERAHHLGEGQRMGGSGLQVNPHKYKRKMWSHSHSHTGCQGITNEEHQRSPGRFPGGGVFELSLKEVFR